MSTLESKIAIYSLFLSTILVIGVFGYQLSEHMEWQNRNFPGNGTEIRR